MGKRNNNNPGYTLEEAALALRRVYDEHFQRVRHDSALAHRQWRRAAARRRWKTAPQST